MSTERLYYQDSWLTEFDARVVEVARDAEGRSVVTLDRTAFYPTGGGQPSDTGRLGAARVVECVDAEAEGVRHVVEGDAPAVGSSVRGLVDWPRRLDHIQQHTGQHILSQAFVELFGAQTRSFRMLAEASEVDIELKDPSDELVERAVDRANRIIWEDRPVRIHQLTPEEAARLSLRKDSAREGELRVIEIEGFDFSPCGGTHARRTGEVGLIAARHWERAKGLARVTFVAGGRALSDYRRANRTARAAAAHFSVGRDEVDAAVARLLEEHRQLQRRARALEEIAARAEARELLEEAGPRPSSPTLAGPSAPGPASVGSPASGLSPDGAPASGPRVVVRAFEGRDAEGLRRLALAVAAHPGAVALLGSRDDSGARLVFARAADAPGDMNALMRQACQALEGRGGGRPDLAQGGGPRADRLQQALDAAAQSLNQ